ncbi:hypothetical protein F5B17DRAFT_423880 [Nemania serpens]|nr:hypothetical protein F5B17DRAFT_423880 [Nemania serpens]
MFSYSLVAGRGLLTYALVLTRAEGFELRYGDGFPQRHESLGYANKHKHPEESAPRLCNGPPIQQYRSTSGS